MKIYWKIQQDCAGIILHVDKEFMRSLGIKYALDYYASRRNAERFADRYARLCASLGMSSSKISIVSGTFE